MLPEISFYLSFLLILILPISNFTYAKDVAESSHKMEHGDTKNLEKKFPPEQFECIGDFLVRARQAKSLIVADFGTPWKLHRVVVPQEENGFADLVVFEPEMANVMDHIAANKCFKLNSELVEFGTWEPEKHNERAKVQPFIRIGPLWGRSKNGRVPVSEVVGKKLDEQSKCLATFLANSSSLDHLKMVKAPWIPINSEGAILRANLLHKNWLDLDMNVLRWMWKNKKNLSKSEQNLMMAELAKNMENMMSIKGRLKGELLNCEEKFPIIRETKQPEYEENTALLRSLLKRFPEDQFFLQEIPKRDMVEGIATDKCMICLEEFEEEEEEKGEMLRHCGHFFHKDCIEKWFDTYRKNNCPACQQKILYRADLKTRYEETPVQVRMDSMVNAMIGIGM